MKPTTKRPRTAPKKVWIIMDPLDGAHLFTSHSKAVKTLKRWEKEADNDPSDSVWDMNGPFEYEFLC
jgi:hypothetical protein